jgi:hypothetical protein
MIAYAVEGTPVPVRSLRPDDARRYAAWFEWVEGLPPASSPQLRNAWARMACGDDRSAFVLQVQHCDLVDELLAIETMIDRRFRERFGDARVDSVQRDYLAAVFHHAADDLPHRRMRKDPRWFAWALQIEAAVALVGMDDQDPRRTLMLAGIASGCPVDFAWHGERPTRVEYRRDATTVALLHRRGLRWATDYGGARTEVHALFRIHELGHDPLATR